MTDTITLFEEAILLVVLLSAPPLLVAIVSGVLISLIQTVFQVQDQTLPFTVKLIAVSITLSITGVWIGGEISLLTHSVFTRITDIGR